MKRFPLIFLALCSLCCYAGPVAKSAPTSLIEKLQDQTAALVTEDILGSTHVYCTAVWIGQYTLLTAAHCAEATIDDDKNAIGQTVSYVVQGESNGPGEEPKAQHVGQIAKLDHAHDLATIKTGVDTPVHSYALLALAAPRVGEDLHFFGHPAGFTWTYTHGWCAAYRGPLLDDELVGPWMQVSAPIWFGNSGGGAFSSTGELVGIASFKSHAPSMAFYVHIETIRAFLLT